MMNTRIYTKPLLLAFIIISYLSCSKEDDSSNVNLQATDLITTVVENPEIGQVLGTITVNENSGTTYAVNSSEPQGAITVDAVGQVLVADPTAFDFESRNTIVATLTITNGDSQTFSNVVVTISDANDLLTLLTSSRDAFEVSGGDWIEVTEDEYNTLSQRMANIIKVGVTDGDFNASLDIKTTAGDVTWSNSLNIAIPSGSYLFAFKYVSPFGTNNNNEGQVRPKVSETFSTSGFIGRGPLPAHGPGTRYFVDGNSIATTSSNAYLGLYSPYPVGYKENNANQAYYRFGNGNDLSNTIGNDQILIQGLTTTEKQWD